MENTTKWAIGLTLLAVAGTGVWYFGFYNSGKKEETASAPASGGVAGGGKKPPVMGGRTAVTGKGAPAPAKPRPGMASAGASALNSAMKLKQEVARLKADAAAKGQPNFYTDEEITDIAKDNIKKAEAGNMAAAPARTRGTSRTV